MTNNVALVRKVLNGSVTLVVPNNPRGGELEVEFAAEMPFTEVVPSYGLGGTNAYAHLCLAVDGEDRDITLFTFRGGRHYSISATYPGWGEVEIDTATLIQPVTRLRVRCSWSGYLSYLAFSHVTPGPIAHDERPRNADRHYVVPRYEAHSQYEAKDYPQWSCNPAVAASLVHSYSMVPASVDTMQGLVVDGAEWDKGPDGCWWCNWTATTRGMNEALEGSLFAYVPVVGYVSSLSALEYRLRVLRFPIGVLLGPFGPGDLPGAVLTQARVGHLMLLVGFDADGNPILVDPYRKSEEDGQLLRIIPRAEYAEVARGYVYTAVRL